MDKLVKVTADSTCDLSEELLEQWDITLTPLYVNLGEKCCRDRMDVEPKAIFAYYEQTGNLAKTAAISPEDYIEMFRPYREEGREIVHICISSEFSCCYQNACIAAQELGGVTVIDSRNLSTGSGHLVMIAAELARAGKTPGEIEQAVLDAVPRVDASFVVDTLEYLYKGGRCSALAALGSNLLRLKPCIEVKEGKMGVGKKYRGRIEKCIRKYVADRLESLDGIDPTRIFITHTMTAASMSIVDDVKRQVESYGYFKEIIPMQAGSTIACHCGPDTLGILYLHKKA